MEELKELGLNDKEISIYLALVKFGAQSIWDIASKINYKRTSVYDYIKSLLQKNVIIKKKQGKKTVYDAVDPEYLLEIFNSKKEKIEYAVKKIKELKQVKFKESEKIIYYYGKEGLRTIMNLILFEEKNLILGYGSNKLSEEVLSFYPENFAQKRLEKNISLNAIIEPGEKFGALKNKKFTRKTKIKHHELMKNYKIVVFITSKKVVILSLDENEPKGIIIEDKSIHDSQKQLFNYLWKESK